MYNTPKGEFKLLDVNLKYKSRYMENQISSPSCDVLSSGNLDLDNFLSGGFKQGLIYELIGNSCTGKTYFLKKLLKYNIESINKKILIIDTSGSYTFFKQYKNIEYKEFFFLKDLFSYLSTFVYKNYCYIIIDSLQILAPRWIDSDETFNKHFGNLILNLRDKGIGIIYTNFSKKNSQIELYNFNNDKERFLLKNFESELQDNVIYIKDYVLNFHMKNYNYLNNPENKIFYLRLQDEKKKIIENKILYI